MGNFKGPKVSFTWHLGESNKPSKSLAIYSCMIHIISKPNSKYQLAYISFYLLRKSKCSKKRVHLIIDDVTMRLPCWWASDWGPCCPPNESVSFSGGTTNALHVIAFPFSVTLFIRAIASYKHLAISSKATTSPSKCLNFPAYNDIRTTLKGKIWENIHI